jgi:hypothetical protein
MTSTRAALAKLTLAAAVGLFAVGGLLAAGAARFLWRAEHTVGQSLSTREHHWAEFDGKFRIEHSQYLHVLQFATRDGRVVQVAGPTTPQEAPDARVPIAYDPAEPSNARIDTFAHLWGDTAAVLFLSVAAFAVAIRLRRAAIQSLAAARASTATARRSRRLLAGPRGHQ